jgi:hypothetical protein
MGLVSFFRAFSGILFEELVEPDSTDRLKLIFKARSPERAGSSHPIAVLLGMVTELGWVDPRGWQGRLPHAAAILHYLVCEDALLFILLHEIQHALHRHTKPGSDREGVSVPAVRSLLPDSIANGTVQQEAAYGHEMEYQADELAFMDLLLRRSQHGPQRAQIAYLGISLLFFALETVERFGGVGTQPAWMTHPTSTARMDRLRRFAVGMARHDARFSGLTELDEGFQPGTPFGTLAREKLRFLVPRSPIDDLINRCSKDTGDSQSTDVFLLNCLLWLMLGNEERVIRNLANAASGGRRRNYEESPATDVRAVDAGAAVLVQHLAHLLRSTPPLDRFADRLVVP